MAWQLQAAKQHFSELVERARRDGPQVVTKHGKDAVVVVSVEEYTRLRGAGPRLVEFIRSAPDFDVLDLDRAQDPGRAVELLSFLLDTNVVSEIRRGRDPHVRTWAETVQDTDLKISVITLGEIRKGIELLRTRDPAQAEVFASWLGDLHARFAERILPIDAGVAEDWGRLNATATRNGIDSLIAATARVHGLTVVTRNTRDFEGCGVALLNPWRPQPETSD